MMHAQTYEASPTAVMLREAYKARRAREAAAARGVRQDPKVTLRRPVVEPIYAPPMWRREEMHFDWHVEAYRTSKEVLRIGRLSTMRAHVRSRSMELGFSYSVIASGKRESRAVSKVRHQLIWEIKTSIDPSISWCDIGRLFGLDHSSAINAFRRYKQRLEAAQ
ncbi:hypothetical protein LH464_21400 [Neorhizobium sp. T786]|uniref:hypothetical protein n=1 Tax=Pseudorhizobium xiangyangii TaxID=2883104 RepID=UPI001CFFBC4C|nr:hypothetical protein [Neorhizobium xiangyangii]MCB5205026.1 hypothetical protein [Neorhizobium xiangyangii]